MRRLLISLFLVAGACASAEPTSAPRVSPSGPPSVRPDVVAEHADQFDSEVPTRPAGSQEEQIASAYILGHLQQAGYLVSLEGVPVGDLVRSTDVIALPPGGDPELVVAVPYDTGDEASIGDQGATLGLFLELARALRVAHPEHRVEFVALGAERATVEGGLLGSRRFINLLRDDDLAPEVLSFYVRPDGGVAAGGSSAEELRELATEAGYELGDTLDSSAGEAFRAADLPFTSAAGDAQELGDVLLRWLGERAGSG